MQLTRLSLYRLKLPLLSAFEHAGARRDRTDNVVCAVTFEDGVTGYGEAVARAYVTGETPELVWELLQGCVAGQPTQLEIPDGAAALELAGRWAEAITDRPPIVANATRCAIELALIDGLFKRLGTSPVPWLARRAGRTGVPERPNLTHSLVAGKGLLADEGKLRELKASYGYTAVKAKVGFGLEQDLENLARVRRVFGAAADLRVDANRAWSFDQAAAFLERARPLGIRTIEDPLAGEDLEQLGPELHRLRTQTGCEVVLDEPVRTLAELQAAIAHQAVDVVSVRLSKCGGLLRSLELAACCARAGVGVQLGCQVGETAILSAAGRRFAQAVGELRFLEGSNERLKFSREHDLCVEDLMYGPDAAGAALAGPGLGVEVLRDRLQQLSTDRVELDLRGERK